MSPRVAVDAAGKAVGLRPVVEGALDAAREDGLETVLVGPAEPLHRALRDAGADEGGPVSVIDAPDAPSPEDDPAAVCRDRPDASLSTAVRLVAEKKADACVSAAGLGHLSAAGLWHLKRLKGTLKPCAAAVIPTVRGTCLLLDAGVNADCKPWHLLQFAVMGAHYARLLLGIEAPALGLVSPDPRSCAAPELGRETEPLLRYTGLASRGLVRPADLIAGSADVAVCDGATGDVCLSLASGLTTACFEILKSEADSGLFRRMGRGLMRAAMDGTESKWVGTFTGPVPVLGVGGAVVQCRDGHRAAAVAEAVRTAARLAGSGFAERVQERLGDIKSDMEFARAID